MLSQTETSTRFKQLWFTRGSGKLARIVRNVVWVFCFWFYVLFRYISATLSQLTANFLVTGFICMPEFSSCQCQWITVFCNSGHMDSRCQVFWSHSSKKIRAVRSKARNWTRLHSKRSFRKFGNDTYTAYDSNINTVAISSASQASASWVTWIKKPTLDGDCDPDRSATNWCRLPSQITFWFWSQNASGTFWYQTISDSGLTVFDCFGRRAPKGMHRAGKLMQAATP